MAETQAMYLVPKELRGTLTAEEFRHLKRRVVAANRAMGYWYQQVGQDCISMTSGHVSARVPGTNTFISKSMISSAPFATDTSDSLKPRKLETALTAKDPRGEGYDRTSTLRQASSNNFSIASLDMVKFSLKSIFMTFSPSFRPRMVSTS